MASTKSHQSRNWGEDSELREKVVQAVLELLQYFDQRLTPLDVVVEILSCKGKKYSHTRQAMLTAKSIARISSALAECGIEKYSLKRSVALRLVLARVDAETRKIVSRLGEASMHPILLGHVEVRKEDGDAPVLKAVLEQVNVSTARAREGDFDEEGAEETTFKPASPVSSKIGVDYTDDASESDFTDNLEIHASSKEDAAFTDSTRGGSTWDTLFSSSYDLFGSMREHVTRLIGREDTRVRMHERKSDTSIIEKGNTRAANLDCLSGSQMPILTTSRKRPREDSDDDLDDAFPTMSVPPRNTSAATSNGDNLQSSNTDAATSVPNFLTASSVVPSTPASSSSLSPLAPSSTTINRNANANAGISSVSFISPEPPPSVCMTGSAGNGTREQNESPPSSKLSYPSKLNERKESPSVLQNNPKTPDIVDSCGEANATCSTSSELRKSPATATAYISAVEATPTGETSRAKRKVRNVVFSAQSSSADLAAEQVGSSGSGSASVTKASEQGNEKGKSEGTPKSSPTSTPAKRGRRRKRMKISAEVVRNSVSPHSLHLHDLPGFASGSNANLVVDEKARPSSTTPSVPVPVDVQVPVTKAVYDTLHPPGSRSNNLRSESTSATPGPNLPQDGQNIMPTSSKSKAKPKPKSAPHIPISKTSITDPSGPSSQVTEAPESDELTAFPVPVYPSVAASLSQNIVASMGPKDWLGSGLSSNGNPDSTLGSNSNLGTNINSFAMGPSDWPTPMPFPSSALPLPNQLASYAPFQFPQTSTSGISSSSDANSSKDGTAAQAFTSSIRQGGLTSVLSFIPGLEVITSSGTTSTSVSSSTAAPSDWPTLGPTLPALPTSGACAGSAILPASIDTGSSVGAGHSQDRGVDRDASRASRAVSPGQELIAITSIGSGAAMTPEINTPSTSALDITGVGTTTEPVATPDQSSAQSWARVPNSTKARRLRLPKRPVNVQTKIPADKHGRGRRRQGHQAIRDTTKLYTCERCLKNYKTKRYYEDHVRGHDGATPYKCPVKGCTKVFSVYSSYRKHARSPHEGLAESKVNDYQNDVDADDGDDDAVSRILQAPAEVNGSCAVEMPSNAEASQTDPELGASSPTLDASLSRSSSTGLSFPAVTPSSSTTSAFSPSFLRPFLRKKSGSNSEVVFEKSSVLELPLSSSNLETIS